MAGSIVNAASVASATTSLVCNKPTGTAQSDVLVAAVATDFATYAAMTAPGGWTLRAGHDQGANSIHLKVFTLTAGAAEGSTYTFVQGASSDGVCTIVAVRGVEEAGLIAPTPTYTSTTGSTRTAPTVSGANSGAVLLAGAMTDGSGGLTTWTPPSGMTEQGDVQSATFTTQSVATLLDPGSPTGTKDFVCTGTPVAPGGVQWSLVLLATPNPRSPVLRPGWATMRGTW